MLKDQLLNVLNDVVSALERELANNPRTTIFEDPKLGVRVLCNKCGVHWSGLQVPRHLDSCEIGNTYNAIERAKRYITNGTLLPKIS